VRRGVLLAAMIVLLAGAPPARASQNGATLHEPIPPDAREDLAMHVSLDGDLPAALQTPSGVVSAPDPRAMPSSADRSYGSQADSGVFSPDRDTRRPEVSAYDDPFTPSTAPFKRLEAFDAVREDYTLYVRDTRLAQIPLGAPPSATDEAFYADIVVDVTPGTNVRIPSVGPGARIVRARLGIGSDDLSFHVVRDGADDWFLQAPGVRVKLRARLVMELAIPRAAFGGEMGNPSWSDLPAVPPLPDNVARDAAQVRAAVGVSRVMRPRDAIGKMVQYFRGFADSDEPPTGQGNVYLDLALSKKGVCRHRSFAFLVTAQSLGVPTRLVLNEAHAWVEIHDGALWRRVDLGGAGRMAPPPASALADRAAYRPPPDTFSWPQNSRRGDDMVADARAGVQAPNPNGPPGAASASASATAGAGAPDGGAGSKSGTQQGPPGALTDRDDRPPSAVTLAVTDSDPHRGMPLHVRGDVRADGEACAHVAVEVWLRDARTQKAALLGTLATGDDGAYAGGIVVPGTTPLGDYDVFVRTPGDARCGSGGSN
jgi:transglutaminase-like putative cysteine protease